MLSALSRLPSEAVSQADKAAEMLDSENGELYSEITPVKIMRNNTMLSRGIYSCYYGRVYDAGARLPTPAFPIAAAIMPSYQPFGLNVVLYTLTAPAVRPDYSDCPTAKITNFAHYLFFTFFLSFLSVSL